MNREESLRFHWDWWGKCRTCRFWTASDEQRIKMDPAICSNEKSPFYNQETWTEGHCPNWDSFDTDAAIEMLERVEDGTIKYGCIISK